MNENERNPGQPELLAQAERILILTDEQLKDAIETEIARVTAATNAACNSYGDLLEDPPGCRCIPGRHSRGVKRTKLTGRWSGGFPGKRVVHVTSELLEGLYDEAATREQKAAREAAQSAARTAAIAAGLTVTAWKKQRRAVNAKAKAEAHEKAIKAREADVAYWLKVVTDVLGEKRYNFFPEIALEMLLEKIASNKGVGKAWNNLEFDGDRHAFARCVLGAADRHENTNYDALLRAGYDREVAIQLRKRC